jgi:hypothetical protein
MERFIKRTLYVFLMMTCSVSWAEWEESGASENFVHYVDRATIRKKGNFVEMWSMKNFFEAKVNSAGEMYRSTKELRRYECKEETRGLVSFIFYTKENGAGDAIFSHTLKKNEIEDNPITPGAVDEVWWKIACGKK